MDVAQEGERLISEKGKSECKMMKQNEESQPRRCLIKLTVMSYSARVNAQIKPVIPGSLPRILLESFRPIVGLTCTPRSFHTLQNRLGRSYFQPQPSRNTDVEYEDGKAASGEGCGGTGKATKISAGAYSLVGLASAPF